MTTADHARPTARSAEPAAGSLSAVEAHPERPRQDPFQVDVSAALEALAATWGTTWDIGHVNGLWRAQRRDGTGLLLTCETPDELVRAMRGSGGAR